MSHLIKIMIASLVIYISMITLALNLLSHNLELPIDQILSHSFPQKGSFMKMTHEGMVELPKTLANQVYDYIPAQLDQIECYTHALDTYTACESSRISSRECQEKSYRSFEVCLWEKDFQFSYAYPHAQTLEIKIAYKN